ncbi:hypothetical protein QQZ08_008208 [Neonectria magnoliae]|uniref:Class II aldolase/adducin N-terminal domain-containing protein n=1 Tax=Neonectria magnoliae TaxID=2732573 RepID=A0ABR1HXH9_9HYPO
MSTTTTAITTAPQASSGFKVEAAPAPAVAALATGGYEFAGIPDIADPYKKRRGHISVRDPVDPTTFWINPLGVHFGMLKASDMVQVDEGGQVIGGNKTAVNVAGFMIHSAIHRARPDGHPCRLPHPLQVRQGLVHLRPAPRHHQPGSQAVYKSFGGVVLGEEEGQRIVDALGDKGRVIVLQNHGILTAGGTVDEAAYLCTLVERSCEVQLLVESAGLPKNYIGDKEAEFTAKVNADPPDFEYEIWKSNGELRKGE